jgi:FkbM family methyltransferase
MIRQTKQLTSEEYTFYTKIESELKVVFDVGATNSFFNELDCEVHFFEPQLTRYNELVGMTKENDRYFHNQLGCGDTNGSIEIFNDLSSTQWRDVPKQFGVKNKSNVEIIEIIRLDSYLGTLRQVPEISLLKLDIEGAEYSALLGMGNLLNKCKYITFEYGWDTSEVFNFKLQDILDLLNDFDTFKMTINGLTPVNVEAMEKRIRPNANNLVAIRKD